MLRLSKIFNVFIIFYLYWIPFEWTILSFISDFFIIQLIRSFIDLTPLFFLIAYILVIKPKVRIFASNILISFTLIVLLLSISLIYEKHNLKPIVTFFGASFRYVPFIFLTRLTSESANNIFIKNVKIVYWIQVVLALFQLLSRELFMSIFLPKASLFGDTPPNTYYEHAINTTFIHTIEFSFFIVSLTIIYIFSLKSQKYRIAILILSLVMVTLSRSAASIIAIIIVGYFASNRKLVYSSVLIVPIVITILFNQSLLKGVIGSRSIKSYIELSSKYNRVGYFTRLLPEFLSGNPKDIFLGMGVDEDIVNKKLARYKNLPLMLTFGGNNLMYLKDVYWISVIISQGFLVFLIVLFILRTIYTHARKYLIESDFGIIKSFVIIILFLGFFNQVMDIKCFSFCFWVMVGLTFNKSRDADNIEVK